MGPRKNAALAAEVVLLLAVWLLRTGSVEERLSGEPRAGQEAPGTPPSVPGQPPGFPVAPGARGPCRIK